MITQYESGSFKMGYNGVTKALHLRDNLASLERSITCLPESEDAYRIPLVTVLAALQDSIKVYGLECEFSDNEVAESILNHVESFIKGAISAVYNL